MSFLPEPRDHYHIADHTSAGADELLPVGRPIKIEDQAFGEIGDLLRRASVDRLAPNVCHTANRVSVKDCFPSGFQSKPRLAVAGSSSSFTGSPPSIEIIAILASSFGRAR